MLSSDELKLVKGCFLFSDSSDEEIKEFLSCGECFVKDFPKGSDLLMEENGEKRLGILLSGKASAVCGDGGRGSIKSFSVGDLFGAACVFCKEGSEPFSRMEAKRDCRVFFITKRGIERFILKKPEKALGYIGFLSERVAFLNRRISTFTSGEAVSRVAKHLLNTADKDLVCKNLNFSALAKSLDISRASLYRAKSELIELKAIATNNKDVIILDRDALKNII